MTNYTLKANLRTATGRKVRALRKTGVVPANVFGKKIKSVAIQLDVKILREMLKKAGETSLINLTIEGEKKARPVLVSGYAQDPITSDLYHVDFHEVDLTEKVTAMVPIKVVGEAEAVKAGNNLVVQKNEIEVEALPADLPDEIEVDVTALAAVGDSIHAKDLKVDRSKVTLLSEEDETIVTIQEPAKEEETVAAPAEGEAATTDDKPAEGEAKAEDKKE